MSSMQIAFTLRTSPNAKTVHLIGSWDGYKSQLPLSKDSSKTGGWKGTFRFQGSMVQPGNRYWYYYIVDGYHCSHDPSKPSTVEPTTKRALNILDLTAAARPHLSVNTAVAPRQSRQSKRMSADIPQGRSLSPSRIVSPRPVKPNATRTLEAAAMRTLTSQLAQTSLSSGFDSDSDSDLSDVPSLSSSGSSRAGRSPVSPASSLSAFSRSSSSNSCCTCERFGITRKGDRVRLDCGGQRCGYSDESSSCASDSEDESAYYKTKVASPRAMMAGSKRHGLVVRGSSRR